VVGGFVLPSAGERLARAVMLAITERTPEGGYARPPHRSPGPAFAAPDADRVEALVTLAQEGDAEAFGQLYERSVDTVFRYVYVRTGDRHLSEDITSETFVRAWRTVGTFTWQGRDIVAWFLTIARNLLIDTRKSARFRLEISTDDLLDHRVEHDTPELMATRHQHERDLVAALRRLTPDQAECVVLRFVEGLSLAECAEVLGRNENAVKQLQLRAIRALRKELGHAG
jgi:RNA polymerase sigma-70 factor (ECF subfamily)